MFSISGMFVEASLSTEPVVHGPTTPHSPSRKRLWRISFLEPSLRAKDTSRPAMPSACTTSNSYGAWAADNWQVTPKLNLNLGLRYEYNTPLAESTTNKGISTFLPSSPTGLAFADKNGFGDLYPSDRNNFAPRIGFAYSPVRGGKTVIRGAWGIFYDVTNGNLFIDNRVDGAAGRGISRNPGGTVPVFTVTNLTTETVQQGVPIFGATQTPPFGAFAVNQQIRSPYVQNFNINVQRQFSRAFLLQVGYVGNQGRKLPVNLRSTSRCRIRAGTSRSRIEGPTTPSSRNSPESRNCGMPAIRTTTPCRSRCTTVNGTV